MSGWLKWFVELVWFNNMSWHSWKVKKVGADVESVSLLILGSGGLSRTLGSI
jgi:hypothetical protein